MNQNTILIIFFILSLTFIISLLRGLVRLVSVPKDPDTTLAKHLFQLFGLTFISFVLMFIFVFVFFVPQ